MRVSALGSPRLRQLRMHTARHCCCLFKSVLCRVIHLVGRARTSHGKAARTYTSTRPGTVASNPLACSVANGAQSARVAQAVQQAPRVGPPGPPAKHPTSIIVGSVLGGIALLAFCVACCGLARTRRRRKALQQRPGAIQSVKSFEALPAEASALEGAPELPPITAATAGPVSPPSAHGSSGEFLTPRAADADAQAAVRAAAEAHLAAVPNAGRPYVEAG